MHICVCVYSCMCLYAPSLMCLYIRDYSYVYSCTPAPKGCMKTSSPPHKPTNSDSVSFTWNQSYASRTH